MMQLVVEYDPDFSIADAIGDEPVMIFSHSSRGWNHQIYDGSKKSFPSHYVLRAIAQGDWQGAMESYCERGYVWCDQLPDGRICVEYCDWSRARYFKTWQSAFAGIWRADRVEKLSDLRVDYVSDRDGDYFMAWYQSELDEYAGCKRAESPMGALRDVVNGDVYQWSITDDDGNWVEGCGGYVGPCEYCESEGMARMGGVK